MNGIANAAFWLANNVAGANDHGYPMAAAKQILEAQAEAYDRGAAEASWSSEATNPYTEAIATLEVDD